ncbi:MAG: hypothetical protein ABIT76_03175 [Chthoniobacterales bacterium]
MIALPKKNYLIWFSVTATVLFIGITFWLYWGCLRGEFIWDDNFLVKNNPLIRSPKLFFEIYRHFLGYDPSSNFYRPTQTLTYLLDYWRGGIAPIYYHQTNVIIHGLNAGLFFTFLMLRLKKETAGLDRKIIFGAFLVSLLWLVQPIHSATVAYIAGRADSLALLFLLATWCLWEKIKQSSKRSATLLLFTLTFSLFLALGSKEAALIGMAFFLLNTLFLENELSATRKWSVVFACLFLFAIYLALRFSINNVTEPNSFFTEWPERPKLILCALGDYLRLLIYPGNLRMERQVALLPNLYVDPASFDPLYPWLAIIGIIFIVLLLTLCIYRGKHQPLRRFGVAWFCTMLLPVSNVFSLNSTVAEHWLYIPSIGFFIALLGSWLEATRNIQRIATLFIAIWIIGLSCRTVVRSKDWITPITFFEKTIHDGGDTARMRVNLANEYRKVGRFAEGETVLRFVLQKSPTYFQARHALAANLQAQGNTDEASQLISDGENALGSSFSGKIYLLQHMLQVDQIQKAGSLLKELRQQYPDSWMITKDTLLFFDKVNQSQNKLTVLQSFAERHWWHRDSLILLGDYYADAGCLNNAIASYKNAAELDIRDAGAYNRIVSLLVKNSNYSEAIIWEKKALDREGSLKQIALLNSLRSAAHKK